MRKTRILVVDDEPRLVRLIKANLETEGYEVASTPTGREALRKVEMEDFDLIILDIVLPGDLDGYEVCRRIRDFSQVPIIMLTAKDQEMDKIEGFKSGTDDYLTKPFSSKELMARVKAVLRRSGGEETKTVSSLQCGDLTINFAQATVTSHGRTVDLTPTEYRLLCELAKHVNEVVFREDLLTSVWGPEYRDETDYLRAYIWYLRKKIEKNPSEPVYIISRPGLGYMLACPGKGVDQDCGKEDPGERAEPAKGLACPYEALTGPDNALAEPAVGEGGES